MRIDPADVTAISDLHAPRLAARIARIRTALAEGRYAVDLDRLAAAILDDDLARRGATGRPPRPATT